MAQKRKQPLPDLEGEFSDLDLIDEESDVEPTQVSPSPNSAAQHLLLSPVSWARHLAPGARFFSSGSSLSVNIWSSTEPEIVRLQNYIIGSA
ncbi:hypothetical protein V7S43_014358 [Phytophthora oleae]|uniref:PiggyBac transposable element-derived protein domain-containing protein n=1 Tax=Phytophthora oleae TaxID=2107226 RepID=A0ABD3F1F8_9STRA